MNNNHHKYSTSTSTTNIMAASAAAAGATSQQLPPIDATSSSLALPVSVSRRPSTATTTAATTATAAAAAAAAAAQFDLDQQQRHYYVSVKFLFRWLVMLWLSGGIIIYLINATRSVRSVPPPILGLPWKVVYVLAIANHLSLIGAVFFDLGPLLIISTVLQCALLVALPTLIVDVVPNLLTYSVLLLSIVMLLCYGVLYMRSNAVPVALKNGGGGSGRGGGARGMAGFGQLGEQSSRSGGAVSCMIPGSRKASLALSSPQTPDGVSAKVGCALGNVDGLSSVEIEQQQTGVLTESHLTPSHSTLTIPRNSCQF